jgi:hypothetical protein
MKPKIKEGEEGQDRNGDDNNGGFGNQGGGMDE